MSDREIKFYQISESLDLEFDEAYKVKVQSTGMKQRIKKCPPGYKPSEDGTSCVKISALEKIHRSKGATRGNKKKVGQWKRIERKKKRAMKFRTQFGLHDKQVV